MITENGTVMPSFQLGFCTEDDPPEQLVVAFDHRSVLTWRLCLEFGAYSVQPLRNLFASEATLASGDKDSHWTMLPNPSGRGCLNDARGSLVSHRGHHRPPDSFVEQVADDVPAYEQDIPLDYVVKVTSQSGRGHRLRRRPLPWTTDPASADYVLDKV